MVKAELKTQKNDDDVNAFLNSIQNEQRRNDALAVCKIMQEVTGQSPVMWGKSIVGFGSYHYKYASGREGDWMKIGFSPRKTSLTLYIMDGFESYEPLLKKLGDYSTGKSCLYITSLEEVNTDVLKEILALSYASPSTGQA